MRVGYNKHNQKIIVYRRIAKERSRYKRRIASSRAYGKSIALMISHIPEIGVFPHIGVSIDGSSWFGSNGKGCYSIEPVKMETNWTAEKRKRVLERIANQRII